jgi:methyl-accepting chemotaxis protein
VKGALLAPTAGVVSPWELAIALAETAVKNGAEVLLHSEVTEIKKGNNVFHISTDNKMIQSRFVVNAAGVSFNEIAAFIMEISEQIKEISAAIQQMAGGSQQIVSSVKDIEGLSRKTADEAQTVSAATEEQSASMQEIASSSKSLAIMSQELQETVSKFKI